MQRYCKQFYCDIRGDRFCCADCYQMRDCAFPCRNNPVRCRLEDTDYAPPKRRGRRSQLRPK